MCMELFTNSNCHYDTLHCKICDGTVNSEAIPCVPLRFKSHRAWFSFSSLIAVVKFHERVNSIPTSNFSRHPQNYPVKVLDAIFDAE